jgi:drug/metabolite transporter (DMT)-like permease
MTKITLPSPASQPKASKAAIWAAMLAIYIVWGSTYLAIRFAVATIPPFVMASARFLLAGGLLFVVRRALGDPIPTRREWLGAGTLGVFLLLGGNGGVSWAEQYVPSGLTALMVASSPLWMLLLEAFLPGGRRPTRRAVLGVIAGFIGILLLFWPGEGSLLAINPWGALAVLVATLSWAFGSIYSRNLHLPASPMMGTAAEMLVGGLALGLLGLFSGDFARLNLAAISTSSLLGTLYLIVFGALVGFSAYTWLLRVAPTSLVSTYAYVNPLVALVLGVLLGNEAIGPRTLLAAAVILGSVALITVNKHN